MEENCVGKAILNDTCSNVHVVNETGLPILAMGLHDVVISASAEGILVSDKEQSSYIKPFVDGITQQVMFAEKSWGSSMASVSVFQVPRSFHCPAKRITWI